MEERRSFGEELLRIGGVVVVAILACWLALRVLSGIVRLIAWMITTTLIVGVVAAILYFAFAKKESKPRE